jgi:hypothetical protein
MNSADKICSLSSESHWAFHIAIGRESCFYCDPDRLQYQGKYFLSILINFYIVRDVIWYPTSEPGWSKVEPAITTLIFSSQMIRR